AAATASAACLMRLERKTRRAAVRPAVPNEVVIGGEYGFVPPGETSVKVQTTGVEPPSSSRAPLARAAGGAVLWRAVGLSGAKIIALTRSGVLAWLLVPDDFGLFAIGFVPRNLLLGVLCVVVVPARGRRDE